MIRKIVLFVPFQAFVLALLLTPFEYPIWLDDLLERLGATMIPIALVSVGYQLQLSHVRGKLHPLIARAALQARCRPGANSPYLCGCTGGGGQILSVTVFEAAMGPMIGASIVAMDHELDPPLVTMMVGIGIPLSFLTLPLGGIC